MKLALLGGSFNPVHVGHLALADELCVSLGYEKVLFVPTYTPPHKRMDHDLPAEIRAKMLSLAVEDDDRFALEPCEILRQGISYTCDTVRYVEQKYSPTGKVGLVIGRDLFATFHLWKNAQELSRRCDLILAERPFVAEGVSFQNEAVGEYAKVKHDNIEPFDIKNEPLFKDALMLKNEPLSVSSTQIRSRVAKKQAFKYLVPLKVFNYIVEGGFYGLPD